MLSAGKLGALLGLLLLASPIAAVPTGLTARDGTLHPLADTTTPVTSAAKDPLPKSKADLKTKFFKAAPKKDKSCFFTGMDIDTAHNPAQNTQEAKKQCKAVKLTTLDQIWTKNNIVNPGEWQRPFTNDEFNQVLGWISEVFAEETSGVAYLLIPHGSEARKQSIFYSIEYKAMKDGGKVDKIKRVDFAYGTTPTLPNADDDNNLWWKKGAADPPTRPDPPAASSSAPAPAPTPAPAAVTLTCAGTGGSKYINRDGIMKVIDTFCDEAAKQGTLDKDSGSIARNYHKDTPEEVNISMDYRPGLNWRPMKDKCVEQMMIVTDGCDTNSMSTSKPVLLRDPSLTFHL